MHDLVIKEVLKTKCETIIYIQDDDIWKQVSFYVKNKLTKDHKNH